MGKDSEIDQLFGARVKTLRKQAGLTQEQLSELIDKTPDTVSNIERGFSAPRLSTANAIAKALDVEIVELFQFTPSPPGKRAHKEVVEQIATLLVDKDERTLGHIVSLVATAIELAKFNKTEITVQRVPNLKSDVT